MGPHVIDERRLRRGENHLLLQNSASIILCNLVPVVPTALYYKIGLTKTRVWL